MTDEQLSHQPVKLRRKRRRRRAYLRSIYLLPSLATLANAICGFSAIYIAASGWYATPSDPWTRYFSQHSILIAAIAVFLGMFFDVIDGRLARATRHTTDFGGQLDSMADVVTFGVAPAFLSLMVFRQRFEHAGLDPLVTRTVWACGAFYFACAAVRLARFNVSNKHSEQHHYSFLGLPSPAAAANIASLVLLQRYAISQGWDKVVVVVTSALPLVVLGSGMLMVSLIRYPHMVNAYMRGRAPVRRLVLVLLLAILLALFPQVTLAVACLGYSINGVAVWAATKRRGGPTPPTADLPK